MRSIHLEGLRFEGGDKAATYTIGGDAVRGWLIDGTDVRREQIQRPAAHGEFEVPAFLTGRAISWSGDIETETPVEQEHAMRRLSGVLAGGGFGKLVVENESTMWARVQRGGDFDMTMHLYGRVASYRVQFWAPDPRIYGSVHEYASGIPAVNYGNFPASPELIVTGSMPGYSVHGPDGRVLTVSQGLSAGQTHRIDLLTGRVYRDGVLQVGVRRGPVWTVPASSAVVHTLVPASGSGALTVRVTDTFI